MPILRWLGGDVGDVLAVDDDRALGRPLEAGDHPQDRRLAAAGGPEQGDELALLERQVDAADDRVGAEAAC